MLDAFNREIALRRAQGHGETAKDIDKAYDQQQEEGRGGGLFDQDEFHQHAEE